MATRIAPVARQNRAYDHPADLVYSHYGMVFASSGNDSSGIEQGRHRSRHDSRQPERMERQTSHAFRYDNTCHDWLTFHFRRILLVEEFGRCPLEDCRYSTCKRDGTECAPERRWWQMALWLIQRDVHMGQASRYGYRLLLPMSLHRKLPERRSARKLFPAIVQIWAMKDSRWNITKEQASSTTGATCDSADVAMECCFRST